MTSLDGSGTQILKEIVDGYVDRGTRVFFCRIPSKKGSVYRLFQMSGIVDKCGGEDHFVKSVDEALQMADIDLGDA